MINPLHAEILKVIRKNSGKPTQHTFLNSYLGNDHPRYPIANPALRVIAREWMREHRHLTPDEFADVLTSLIQGESCTEKLTAGILLGYSQKAQRSFNPTILDRWLDHLVGWVEVDTLCTGPFPTTQLPADWIRWKPLIGKLSKDKNLNKRRASLVLFCSPVSKIRDERLAKEAYKRIDLLKSEKEIMITKAVSWVLRSMIKHHRKEVSEHLHENAESLPRIALRETLMKLKTGKKTSTKGSKV